MTREQVATAVDADLSPGLRAAADELADLDPMTQAVRERSAAAGLTAVAADLEATAIVVGSSHHGTFGRLALGSTGTALMHGSPCAVLIAPPGFARDDVRHLLRIGVAFDGSPEAWSALEVAIALAERNHSRLNVYTVVEPPEQTYSGAWSALSGDDLMSAEEREKARVLDLAVGRVPAELPVQARLLIGSAVDELSRATTDLDLLVVGSRGYGPIGRTFLGGVSTHVIHHAQSAVLVLPRGAGPDPFRLNRGFSSARVPA
jgi:nucleotide-binding universal stress UspA family protein